MAAMVSSATLMAPPASARFFRHAEAAREGLASQEAENSPSVALSKCLSAPLASGK